MFSGIVEEVGTVQSLRGQKPLAGLRIGATTVLDGVLVGDSIAVNGVCLTVTHLWAESFTVDVAPETVRRTNLDHLQVGSKVNLERSLMVGGRIGGHFVQGHVDSVGKVTGLRSEGNAIMAAFAADSEVMRYVVEKGFIAVDGMSLTIVRRSATGFTIALIPHTRSHSIAESYRVGQRVNLEVDVLAKYVEQLLSPNATQTVLTNEKLKSTGFLE